MKRLAALLGLLWGRLCWVRGLQVQQSPSALRVQEGASPTLRCNFSTTVNNVQWFRQNPGSGLVNLFFIASGTKQNGRLKATVSSQERYSTLHVTTSQLEDSGTYLCAAEETNYGNKLVFGSGTTVRVKPYITDPQPAVYQLRSSDSKSSKLSMCLLTDFDSQTNVSQRTESETVFTSHTVLNMKSLDSKSYGALAWSQNSRLSCQDAFSNHTFLSSSDASCDAKLVEKSFETDMNLNFQNLSVIGLRLLLLKVAGFNLLMTLRLWSS